MFTLKNDAACGSETLVSTFELTCCKIPIDYPMNKIDFTHGCSLFTYTNLQILEPSEYFTKNLDLESVQYHP